MYNRDTVQKEGKPVMCYASDVNTTCPQSTADDLREESPCPCPSHCHISEGQAPQIWSRLVKARWSEDENAPVALRNH